MARYKIIWAFLMCLSACISGELLTEYTDETTTEYIEESTEFDIPIAVKNNKTLSELVQEQTDAIKKIISEHKPPHQDYPVVTRKDADFKDPAALKAEKEKQSIEELKFRCQHYFKLLQEGKLEEKSTTEKPKATILPFGPIMKPEFLRLKPNFQQPTRNKPLKVQTNENYFIFTQNPDLYGQRTNKLADKLETAASTIEEDTVAINNNKTTADYDIKPPPIETTTEIIKPNITEKVKYVKLEPLILQKTLLTNGKTLFYWYRTLPTTHQSFIQIPDTPENANVNSVAQPQNHDKNIPVPEQYQFYVDPETGAIIRNLKPTTTTTTTTTTTQPPLTTTSTITTQRPPFNINNRPQFFINPQTGLIYQNSMPHQFIYHRRANDQTTSTTTTSTTTPKTETTTQPGPSVPNYQVEYTQPTEKFRNEFRFVIPMLVAGNQEMSKYPYQIDPYAYLPKNQRPDLMNVAVPYIPNYHMIRTLSIPQKFQGDNKGPQ